MSNFTQGNAKPSPLMSEQLIMGLPMQNLSITSNPSTHQASDYGDTITQDSTMATASEGSTQSDEGLKAGESDDTDLKNAVLASEQAHPSNGLMGLPEGSLRSFPAEIRQMIFNEVITGPDFPEDVEPVVMKCVLVEALRSESDQTLYKEALEIFYKKNIVQVTAGNLGKVQEMAEDTLSLVKHLAIGYSLPTGPKPRTFTLAPLLQPTGKLLLAATSVEDLTITFAAPITLNQACVALPYELPILVNSFEKLEIIVIILPNENDNLEPGVHPYHGIENQQCVRDMLKTCNQAMRVNGMCWSDRNHQVERILFSKNRIAAGRKVYVQVQGEGSGGEESDHKLEWKEDRIGDGWVAKCTCCDHNPEDSADAEEEEDEDAGGAGDGNTALTAAVAFAAAQPHLNGFQSAAAFNQFTAAFGNVFAQLPATSQPTPANPFGFYMPGPPAPTPWDTGSSALPLLFGQDTSANATMQTGHSASAATLPSSEDADWETESESATPQASEESSSWAELAEPQSRSLLNLADEAELNELEDIATGQGGDGDGYEGEDEEAACPAGPWCENPDEL